MTGILLEPVNGQVAYQGRVKIQGRDNLIAVRLKVDGGRFPRSSNCGRAESHRRRSNC